MQWFWSSYKGGAQGKTRDTSAYGYHYLSGVLRITKKRTIAEISRTAGVPYQNMHHYISDSPWSGPKVIKQVRTEIAWHPHFESGSVLVGDESADARRGDILVGGGRQYNGRLGKVDLCQVGVFLSLVKDGKHNWIDGELFLPEAWFDEEQQALRKRAAVASFLTWAYRQELIVANPMGQVERIKRDPPAPRALERAQVETILARIPATQRRDRLLFRLLVETGLRVGEALTLYVEDVDLTLDDERLHVLGKGNQRRTVLLDDPRLVKELRTYLKQTGYQQGPLFRALKNGDGGPLRYQSVQERWASYCAQAGIPCTLHQLRHTHATELINGGVSLVTIRKRLGHKNLQTTLHYAEQSDAAADAELRAWRRRHNARA